MTEDPRIIGIISEKDDNSYITYCNDAFLFYAGVKSDNQILGHTDIDFPWQEYAHIYRAHELDALAGNNYSTIYPFRDHQKNDHLFLHTKIQKINLDGTKGIKCRAVEIINPNMIELVHILSNKLPTTQNHFAIGKRFDNNNLSNRQSEILFLLLRGHTAKHIAKSLGISYRTVEKYIDIIKDKFNCHSKNEVIEHAIDHGYLGLIPNNISSLIALRRLKNKN